jgi:glycosyltransferase involved in cell wall biosynthesis
MVRRHGQHYDLIIENFIPPVGPSGMPHLTPTPVLGLANFSFWDEMSAKYHLPFSAVSRHRMKKYQWIATTHDSVSERIRTISPQAVTTSISQMVELEPQLWNVNPGSHAVYLGRPDIHQKGLDLLVRALHHLGTRAPRVSIVGFDIDNEAWLKLTQRWPVSSSVDVLGYVRGSAKDELLKMARVLLLPSRYEGPSYVPLEGAVRGIPTVAFDLPCFSDRRQFMYLARPFDIHDYAAQIEWAFSDNHVYEKKRLSARNAISTRNSGRPSDEFRAFVSSILQSRS